MNTKQMRDMKWLLVTMVLIMIPVAACKTSSKKGGDSSKPDEKNIVEPVTPTSPIRQTPEDSSIGQSQNAAQFGTNAYYCESKTRKYVIDPQKRLMQISTQYGSQVYRLTESNIPKWYAPLSQAYDVFLANNQNNKKIGGAALKIDKKNSKQAKLTMLGVDFAYDQANGNKAKEIVISPPFALDCQKR